MLKVPRRWYTHRLKVVSRSIAVQLDVAPSEPKRQKVPLEPNYSQMDWLRRVAKRSKETGVFGSPQLTFTSCSAALATLVALSEVRRDSCCRTGPVGRTDISMSEVRQHRTRDDAWTVLRGKVRLETSSDC